MKKLDLPCNNKRYSILSLKRHKQAKNIQLLKNSLKEIWQRYSKLTTFHLSMEAMAQHTCICPIETLSPHSSSTDNKSKIQIMQALILTTKIMEAASCVGVALLVATVKRRIIGEAITSMEL